VRLSPRLVPSALAAIFAAAFLLPASPAAASIASGTYEPGSTVNVFGRSQGLQVKLASVDISGEDQLAAVHAVTTAVSDVRSRAITLHMHPSGGHASTHSFLAGSLIPFVEAPVLDPPGDLPATLTVVVKLSKSFLAHTVDTVAYKPLVKPVDNVVRVGGPNGVQIFKGHDGVIVDRRKAPATIVKALATGAGNLSMAPVAPSIRSADVTNVIIIHTGANTLQYFVRGKLKRGYVVATVQDGYPTPMGTFRVTTKDGGPSWYNPHDDWSQSLPDVIGPGPDNPLGTRAIGINAPGIFMHGIPVEENATLGSNASHGCIRMLRKDVEDFFPLVPIGTTVVIAH
jgi:lipoprotein-anchoring transpeptidase ErfK/SrfK